MQPKGAGSFVLINICFLLTFNNAITPIKIQDVVVVVVVVEGGYIAPQ